MVTPIYQVCPICHTTFAGSDALGRPCPQCDEVKILLREKKVPHMNEIIAEIMGDMTSIHPKALTDEERVSRVRALLSFWSDVQSKSPSKLRVVEMMLGQLAAAIGEPCA